MNAMPCRHDFEFTFLVTETRGGWRVTGDERPLGLFDSREQAMDLALGMAQVLRRVGKPTVVWVETPSFRPH